MESFTISHESSETRQRNDIPMTPSALWAELQRERQRSRTLEDDLRREKAQRIRAENERRLLVGKVREMNDQMDYLDSEMAIEKLKAEQATKLLRSYKKIASDNRRQNERLKRQVHHLEEEARSGAQCHQHHGKSMPSLVHFID